MSFLCSPIRNSAPTLQPRLRVVSLYIEIEKQPSASAKPVRNHGFKDGSGSSQDVLCFLILKALEEEK
jgi:hypothetical protein